MIGGEDEDSCGKSGTGENPQERMGRGGSASHTPKAKSCTKINGSVTSGSAYVFHLFAFQLDLFRYISTSFYLTHGTNT
ncbi:hypothetical protein [Priestia megaterium]|uniref:hypothetical protein n=1 Tax=Priestia megaterium TaxID=1404 RepID=UPI002AD58DBD|nr:hypothetical protein [Priestia megaterium]